MAGIGFELKKLFAKRGALSKVFAYVCAGGISSGTTVLVIILLLGLQVISRKAGNTSYDVLLVFMIYAMIGSLLVSSILNQLLARYTADMLYSEKFERVLPSLYGGYLVLVVPFGALYALLLSTAADVSFLDKLLNWLLFCEMLMVWLQMGYITALKRYQRVLLFYLIGIAAALGLSALLVLTLKCPIMTSVQISLFCGYGIMMVGFAYELHSQFSFGEGSLLHFVGWIEKYPSLLVIGFFSMSASFVHQVVMWGSPLGECVTGLFYQSPVYDAAAFFAFLTGVPTQINFIVSMEVVFYEKYRVYFQEITGGGTLHSINIARREMLMTLRRELFQMEAVQILFMMFYMSIMRHYLAQIGFTQYTLIIFFLLCIGYSAMIMGTSVMLLLLYFDDRKGAMVTSVLTFFLSLALTLRVSLVPERYGFGMAAAGVFFLVITTIRLLYYTKGIDNRVFCGQPIFAAQKRGALTRLSEWLDGVRLRG